MADLDDGCFDKELFIEEVRLHPYLYSATDKRYRDFIFKDNVWAVIGSQFGLTKDEARTKWKSLRDRYLRERKLYLDHKKCESDCWYTPKWNHFSTLATFIEPALQVKVRCNSKHRRSAKNEISADKEDEMDGMSDVPVESTITVDDRLLSVANLTVIKSEPNDESLSDLQSGSCQDVGERNDSFMEDVPANVFKRRRVEDADSGMASLLATASDGINRLVAEKRLELDEAHDDTFYYFSYLMARFRKLTPSQQRFVRKEFDKTMFEADDLQT